MRIPAFDKHGLPVCCEEVIPPTHGFYECPSCRRFHDTDTIGEMMRNRLKGRLLFQSDLERTLLDKPSLAGGFGA